MEKAARNAVQKRRGRLGKREVVRDMSGLSGPSRSVDPHPRATPMALQLRWGLGSARPNGNQGISLPRLAAVGHAAAAPNPCRGLDLGWLVSLR